MRYFLVLLASLFITACSDQSDSSATNNKKSTETVSYSADGPECVKSESWKYIINNGLRKATNYASDKGSYAAFIGPSVKTSLIKQVGGKYQGKYLLKIISETNGNVSFMMMLPKFDVNKSTDDLDDESNLWTVVVAKYNGIDF